jgi:predicted nucleic-acid-binding Zn-ribbon protein
METVRLKLQDKDFACTVCNCSDFVQKKFTMKEESAGLFAATTRLVSLICTGCGYVHMFVPEIAAKTGRPQHGNLGES